jgi:hypothetical protein
MTPPRPLPPALALLLIPALLASAETEVVAPIAHWVFDEQDDVIIQDHSPNGNTAEIVADGVLKVYTPLEKSNP